MQRGALRADQPVADDDEVAVLPPVSGGSALMAAQRRAHPSAPARCLKEVEERRSAVLRGCGVSLQAQPAGYAVVYDIDGPRVRLGMVWFVVALRPWPSDPCPRRSSTAPPPRWRPSRRRVWRRRRLRPNDVVAAGMAGAMTVGACLARAALASASWRAPARLPRRHGDTRSPHPAVADAGWTVQCALFPGLAAMSMVLLARLDQGSAIALLLLVSAYETGDYIVGSGANNPYEGPAAGLSAIAMITFIVSTLPISTLSFGEAWLFGGIVAVLAPLGQLFASRAAPRRRRPRLRA